MNSFSANSIERPPTSPLLLLDRHAHVGDRKVVGAQFRRIDRDLVLLHEPADRRDFGHAFHGGELVFQIPILHRAQLGEICALLELSEYMNAQPTPVASGPRLGVTPWASCPLSAAEVFEHAAARPVRIGAVFKNDIDERKAVEGIAAHHFRARAPTASWS